MKTESTPHREPDRVKRRRSKPHQLALKIGSIVGLSTALVLVILQWSVWSWSWTGTVVLTLTSAGMAYWATNRLVSRRIKFVQTAIKRIRKHTFESLDLLSESKGDELNDLIRQVYRTGRVVNEEFEELTNLEHYRRDFIGNVSHELKTPIFAIRGFAETLINGALEDKEVRLSFVEKIVRNADRLANLAQDLTEISRLETGRKTAVLQPFDVARWMADVLDSVEPVANASDISVESTLSKETPIALGDAVQLRQVLTNLIVNAIKYSDAGSRVLITVEPVANDLIQVAVHDDGIGISNEHIGRLTERFFRVDKSRSRLGGGTGLGLAIVKHILAAHDQVLQIKSTPGVGSTFQFELQRAPQAEYEQA